MKEKMNKDLLGIKPSGIREFFDIVQQRKNVISLGVGEPDFTTPWNIIEAAFYFMEKGYTHYSANQGLLELRLEISKYLKKYNLDYNENEIIITVGGSEGIDLSLRGLINVGDEVIVPEPIFVPYNPLTTLTGAIPVTIDTSKTEFKITPEDLEKCITPKTKAVILCYPNNPTGAIMNKDELEKIAEVIKKHNIFCITDEIYSELSYGKESHFSIASIEGMKERTIYLNGFSKAFAMTGWRVGFLCAEESISDEINKIHQYAIMCAPTMCQYGALDGLKNSMDEVAKMKKSFNRRRRLICEGLREAGLDLFEPEGALYVFPDISKTGLTDKEFAIKLLEEKNVAVVPGTAFGEGFENYIRCSYATSIEDIKECVKRIKEFVYSLK